MEIVGQFLPNNHTKVHTQMRNVISTVTDQTSPNFYTISCIIAGINILIQMAKTEGGQINAIFVKILHSSTNPKNLVKMHPVVPENSLLIGRPLKLEYLAVYGRVSMAAFRQLSTQIVPPRSNVREARLNTHG